MALLSLVPPLGGFAQERISIPLVPAADWRLVRSESLGVDAVDRFGGDPALDREYGVGSLELRQYQLGTHRAEALMEQASDPTAAYGLLTFYRIEEQLPDKGIEMVFLGPRDAAMARGRVYIRVRAAQGSEVSRHELRALLIAIGGTRLSRNEANELPAPLPSEGLIPHTEKYLLGLEAARRVLPNFRADLIGFAQGAEARVGTYSTAVGQARVLAINYPTPQIARVRFGAMESLLGVNQDKGPGSIYGRRTGSVVVLALESGSRSAAEKLIAQFQVTSSVSWNEPAPERERFFVDLARMILAILMLVFAIALFALLTGVLVVLSRRVAKRFFPDSGWANPEREKLIRLNLSQ